jgi:hypothetical protein
MMKPRAKDIKRFWKQFREMMRSSSLYRWTAALSVFLLALTLALPVWRVLPLVAEQPFIPLHYNVYLGVDRFGPVRDLFFIPAIGLAFLLLNLSVQTLFSKREKLLARFFSIASVILQFALLIAMGLIVLVIV